MIRVLTAERKHQRLCASCFYLHDDPSAAAAAAVWLSLQTAPTVRQVLRVYLLSRGHSLVWLQQTQLPSCEQKDGGSYACVSNTELKKRKKLQRCFTSCSSFTSGWAWGQTETALTPLWPPHTLSLTPWDEHNKDQHVVSQFVAFQYKYGSKTITGKSWRAAEANRHEVNEIRIHLNLLSPTHGPISPAGAALDSDPCCWSLSS